MRQTRSAADRKDEILDVAARLFAERGYHGTSVQALIDEVGIAKGTFYHHFRSKEAVLDALVRRLVRELPPLVAPVVDDDRLDAIEKFDAYFDRIGQWKVHQASLMLEVGGALHESGNLPVLARLQAEGREMSTPFLARIIRQGVDEGVFDTRYPAQAAPIVYRVLEAMGDSLQPILYGEVGQITLERLEAVVGAHTEAIERVLGARPGTIILADSDTLGTWVAAALQRPPTPGRTA